MEIGIQVTSENLESGAVRHTNSSYFTMVAVDKKGKATAVEALPCKTEDQKRRWKEAIARREYRQEKSK